MLPLRNSFFFFPSGNKCKTCLKLFLIFFVLFCKNKKFVYLTIFKNYFQKITLKIIIQKIKNKKYDLSIFNYLMKNIKNIIKITINK